MHLKFWGTKVCQDLQRVLLRGSTRQILKVYSNFWRWLFWYIGAFDGRLTAYNKPHQTLSCSSIYLEKGQIPNHFCHFWLVVALIFKTNFQTIIEEIISFKRVHTISFHKLFPFCLRLVPLSLKPIIRQRGGTGKAGRQRGCHRIALLWD